MSRILQFQVEVTDAEFAAFMERMSTKGALSTGVTIADADGDAAGDQPADAGTLDKNGVPWIDSVHASTKGLTKEGLWRGKKGVTPEQRKQVEDAWKAANPATFTVPGSVVGDGTGGPVNIPATPVGLPGLPTATAPVGLPGLPPTPAPAPSYDDLVNLFTQMSASGKITNEAMGALYAKHGVTDMQLLMTNEAMRTGIVNDLKAIG